MTNILEMLKTCAVEWKPLGEVCKVLRGSRLTKKELSANGKFPVFHGGLIPLGFYDTFNRKANQTMIINTGSVGEVVWSGIDFWSSDGTFVIEANETINNKFLYYFLKIQENYLKTQRREGGVPTIDKVIVEKLPIPIPPLAVQKEIVRILDTFTKLTAELTAELTARKKQYNYYRDWLLTPSNSPFAGGELNNLPPVKGGMRGVVEWKPLGEVVKLEKGKQLNKELLLDTGLYPAYNGGVSYSGFTDNYNYGENTIIVSQGGASAGFVNFVTSKFYANAHCYVVLPKAEVIENRYIYHFLKLNQKKLTEKQHGAGIPALRTSEILEIQIPLPPLAEQARIVAILDKFDTLTNSITEGLPREIDLRKKQYEYYRNMLLSFPT